MKAAGGVEVGAAGVGVVELGGEELQHAPGGLGRGREEGSGELFPGGQIGTHGEASGVIFRKVGCVATLASGGW